MSDTFYPGASATPQQHLPLISQRQQHFNLEQLQQAPAALPHATVLPSQHLPAVHNPALFVHTHQQQQQQLLEQAYPLHITGIDSNTIMSSAQTLASPPYEDNSAGFSSVYYNHSSTKPTSPLHWDSSTILASQQHGHAGLNNIITSGQDTSMALTIGPDGALVPLVPRWDSSYDLDSSTLPSHQPQQQQQRHILKSSVQNSSSRTVPEAQEHQGHTSMLRHPHRQYITQQQQQEQHREQESRQQQQQHAPALFANDCLFDAPSPVPTMSSLDIGIVTVPVLQHQQQHQQQYQEQPQQFYSSPSPIHIPEYVRLSSSPDVPIKTSPVDNPLVWAPWSDTAVHGQEQVVYGTPAHTHTSFEDSPRDDVDAPGTKHLKVFTSSKKDDDGEFRKGQQFYLNVQLSEVDRERYRYLRIPTENIVLPCRADSTGRIGLNASGKRSAEAMSVPTSAQEEDVLSLKLTTYLEPEHRPVVPCGRCKDKTPEILRFHPGVNGKPMIDENGMVTLRNGQVKLIASAWCASTSHHRGPGTKFSFEIELMSMTGGGHGISPGGSDPLPVYQGRSDEVEIYASHGRDKGSRSMSKTTEKSSKSQSPPLHENGEASLGPPSPAKTSSPPGSPSSSSDAHHHHHHHQHNVNSNQYDSGPVKKRREEPPMSPPLLDSDLAPLIKGLEPRSGPICQENHVIIIGQNFARGMTPMFGREYGKVIEINPFYIECTTPRYPKAETVRLWIHHHENFLPSDKTYDFTDEQAQTELEQMLRNMIQQDGEAGGNGIDSTGNGNSSYFTMLGRIAGLPSSTDISGQSQTNGSTMLHNSVLLGYQSGVEILIEEGIELDIEDDSGFTALDYAIHTNHVEITSALLYSGSIVSYERLDKLPLRPSATMTALLKQLCDVDLPSRAAETAQNHVPDLTEQIEENTTEIHIVPSISTSAQISDTILEDVEPVEVVTSPKSHQVSCTTMPVSEAPSTMPSRSQSTQYPLSPPLPVLASPPSKSAKTSRPIVDRSTRPMSIATVSTHSTGMASFAATMSTMAPSATSSSQSRSTMMSSRSAHHSTKGGQENIWQCAKKGNLALVKYHLDKEPTLINAPWKFDGRSVLSSACASSQPQELVEFLVQRGAQVHCADSFYKRTPLHVLCEEGGLLGTQDDWRVMSVSQAEQEANEQDVLGAMRFLLDNGAVVDAKNHWKETALMRLFAGRDCLLMVQELYSRGADSRIKSSKDVYPHGTALCYAAFFGRIKSLKWMIENDLLVNDESSVKEAIRWAKSSKGESTLPQHGHAPVVQSVSAVRRKEERKAEAIRLLEGWLGELGQAKRKTLAKSTVAQQADGWWRRMSGILEDERKNGAENDARQSHPSPSQNFDGLKMPAEVKPLWKDVQTLSETLASSPDHVAGSSGRKWNPLTMLRKAT